MISYIMPNEMKKKMYWIDIESIHIKKNVTDRFLYMKVSWEKLLLGLY